MFSPRRPALWCLLLFAAGPCAPAPRTITAAEGSCVEFTCPGDPGQNVDFIELQKNYKKVFDQKRDGVNCQEVHKGWFTECFPNGSCSIYACNITKADEGQYRCLQWMKDGSPIESEIQELVVQDDEPNQSPTTACQPQKYRQHTNNSSTPAPDTPTTPTPKPRGYVASAVVFAVLFIVIAILCLCKRKE